MKRILILVVMILCLAVGFASAASLVQQNWKQGVTLCDGTDVTAASACATGQVNLGFMVSTGTCHIVVSGTAPTSVTLSMLASADGTTNGYLAIDGTATVMTYTIADATTNTFSWVNQPARYFTGYYASKVGGDGTTAIGLVCTFGGN